MIIQKIKSILFIVIFLFFSNVNLSFAGTDGIDLNLQVGSCNNNGICESGSEDMFTCPLDCTPVIPPSGGSSGSIVTGNIFENLTVLVSYNSATIKWKSVMPTMSNLKWGTTEDYKDGVIKNINYLVDHKVELTNLKDGTLYYFSIQTENLLGKTNSIENQIFRTLTFPDLIPPSNPTSVKAESNIQSITVSWENPKEEDFDYIRVLRNEDRFYSNPSVGRLVYEGNGKYFTDSNVVEDVKYFYSLFSRDRAGNYSSGAIISEVFNPTGKDYWGIEFPLEEDPENLANIYIVTQGTRSYDFKVDNLISLSGDNLINIKTDYTPKTKNDDTWLVIKDDSGAIVGQYFFSRLKNKNGFIDINIPFFEKEGLYSLTINRYHNGVIKVINRGVFDINKTNVGVTKGYYVRIIGIAIVSALIILLLLRFSLIISRKLIKKYNNI